MTTKHTCGATISRKNTIIQLAPLTGKGGIATLSRMIEAHQDKASSIQVEFLNSHVPDEFRSSSVTRAMYTAKIAIQLGSAVFGAPSGTIVHIHTSSFKSFYEKTLFVLISQFLGQSALLHIHGGSFYQFYEQASWPEKKLIRWCLLQPERIVVLSDYWRRVILSIIGARYQYRLCVLPNAADLPPVDFEHGKARSLAQEASIERPLIALFLGRVGEAKGCFELLDAAERLQGEPVIFEILGGSEHDGDLERIQAIARERQLDNVHFRGYVDGCDKLKALRNAALFVLPSHAENMPISILEAMSQGLPIVASNVGAISRVVSRDSGIIVAPRDVDGLVLAIRKLIYSPQLRQKMAEHNLTKFRSDYSPTSFMHRLQELYQAVA